MKDRLKTMLQEAKTFNDRLEHRLDRPILYGGMWMKESTMMKLKKGC